jgi:hypothetical protein
MRLLRSFLALLLLAVAFGASAQSADFDKLERQLRLKPHQKEQFAQARSATQMALVASAMSLTVMKQDLEEELSKARPDFLGLLASQQAAYELNAPLFRNAGEEWNKLYALLEDDQVAIAKRYVEERLRSLPGLIK